MPEGAARRLARVAECHETATVAGVVAHKWGYQQLGGGGGGINFFFQILKTVTKKQ